MTLRGNDLAHDRISNECIFICINNDNYRIISIFNLFSIAVQLIHIRKSNIPKNFLRRIFHQFLILFIILCHNRPCKSNRIQTRQPKSLILSPRNHHQKILSPYQIVTYLRSWMLTRNILLVQFQISSMCFYRQFIQRQFFF